MKFAVLSLGTFCSLTPGSFGSFNLGSLAEITEQGRNGGAISGDGDGRRRGESGGKWRGARVLPSGGLGSSGGGPQRRLHGEGRTAAGLVAGGDVLVGEGGIRRVGELQEAEELPFWGLVHVEEGQR